MVQWKLSNRALPCQEKNIGSKKWYLFKNKLLDRTSAHSTLRMYILYIRVRVCACVCILCQGLAALIEWKSAFITDMLDLLQRYMLFCSVLSNRNIAPFTETCCMISMNITVLLIYSTR